MSAARACLAALLVGVVAITSACAADDGAPPPVQVWPSVAQLRVTHAPPATELAVLDRDGATLATATTDELGSLMFRELPPGPGYHVRSTALSPPLDSGPFEVMSVDSSLPPQRFYDEQTLVPGFQYITTRDGTTLSAYVTMPGPIDQGPYPTVVDYSGYDPSRAGGAVIDEALQGLCTSIPALCDSPSDPSALIAAIFGYATVSVNIRGTGCSGGAFDYFETMELLDGYDVIEVAAAQPWVMNGKVGMVGLSYPGITQLFVASTRPPHLAAIAPMSVIGDSATTMLPGGILNDGFATAWITAVIAKARPYGQGWEQPLVDAGDTQCAENQLLHGQYVDNVAVARDVVYYDPALHDRYNPTTFVDRIDVPVFLASAWQDEQTGPFFFTMLDKFTAAPTVRFNVYNGVHIDAFQPAVLEEWLNFLELFVAQRVPVDQPVARSLAPMIYDQVFGSSELEIHESRFKDVATVEEAVAMWKAEPELRALFESGNGSSPGVPRPTFIADLAAWPPGQTQVLRLYAQPDGSLAPDAPLTTSPPFTFAYDPGAGARGILAPSGNVWDLLPDYLWNQPATGSAVVFLSPPLTSDQVMLGTASVDLWLRSPVQSDADLEINLSEVRPDGQEMYVQSGWIRASKRGSGPDATELWPAPSFRERDAAPLVPGAWTEVRVGSAGFQHVFRAGSRIRVAIDTPGDSRAEWRFANLAYPEGTSYDIGHDVDHPSSVALPVLAGVTAPSALPPCPSLRGQQCRPFMPYSNVPAASP
jgi:predicted acyl esterase